MTIARSDVEEREVLAGNQTGKRAEPGGVRRPLRVAMVAAADYEIDARIRRQAESLVARGDQVTAFVLGEPGQTTTATLEGVELIRLPVPKYRGDSAADYLRTYQRFWLLATMHLTRRPRRFDVIQVHSMPEALVFCAAVPRLMGVPLLLDVHDLTSELFATKFDRGRWLRLVRPIERASMRFASRTITVHEQYAELIRSTHGRAPRGLQVVVNTPDDARFASSRWRAWDDEITYSFHGTLVHRYGVLEMLEALALVKADIPGARLQILGDGDARPDILAAIARLGLSEAVTLSRGRIPVDEMPSLVDAAHIGLAPNLLDRFTQAILPTKVLEYVALGIPVIASRLPVLERYFGEDSICYVRPGDVGSLAEAMLKIARDPGVARARAAHATAALEHIRWPEQRRIYLSVIDELAGVKRQTLVRPPTAE